MKKSTLRCITLMLLAILCTATQTLYAQTFSMASEASSQNTPSGWTAVDLPTGLPEITTANTFDITTYGASTSSSDNTTAIQAALDEAESAGGGMVVIPAGTYLTSYLQMGSKTVLHLSAGATLKMLAMSCYPTDANGYNKMENPLITGKSGASDIVIEGESRETSIIDGQGAAWWDQVETAKSASKSTTRSALIRFWQGSRYLFRNFRIQNAPNTNICIGKSGSGSHTTAHDITIKNPASTASDPSHNTDGFPIWTQYVNIYNCEIDTGDDNVVCDSQAQYVHVWNCDLKAGHGASFGSYTVDMHDIIYEDLTFTGTDCGFRLKSNRDRSGNVYNITFRNCTMTNVPSPFVITSWYDTLPGSPEAAAASPDELISTTPEFHDILIQNVTVSGHTTYKNSEKNYYGIFIYGRPESKVHNVTFDNVNITHSKGIKMNFCEGIKFYDNCSFEVSNTNNTSVNAVAGDDLENVIEEKYYCEYNWKVENETSGIYQWKVTDTPAGGIVTHDRSDLLQIAFGTAVNDNVNNWTSSNGSVSVTYKDITYSFDKYATTSSVNGSNSNSLAADGSTNNNYIAFVPKYSGTLILVGHNMGTNNTEKPTWCYENGVVKSGTIIGNGSQSIAYNGQSDVRTLNGGTTVTGGIKISVIANKLYTFSIQGSKARWCGVIYEYFKSTDTYTVTYENNDADAYGTVPVAVEVNQYESTAIPTNKTLYKTDYTLTGWSDGTNTYAIGANYTPTASVTMHPVFTANSANLGDLATDKTITWNFGKGNGAPDYDGSVNANVQQVNIGSSAIDLGIKMPGGKNDDRTDEWLNNQQKDMMVPVVKGAVVKAKVYYANTNATINGETITYNESTHGKEGNVVFTYTYTSDAPTEIAVNVGNQFLSYISVTYPGSGEAYTNTWQFGKSNGAPEFALEKSAEYTYIVNDHSLMVNTDAGKLNNASRTDQWCQCNNGTLFKVPVFAGAKLTWGRYNSGSQAGFTIDGQLFNDYYIATENGTVEMTASGINYLSYIKIEPTTLYEITGTISGGDINGSIIILTAADNGEKYSATVANNTFTMKVSADTYTPELGGDVAYIISSPESVTVTAAGSIGTITIEAASAQTVTGAIANAPTEAFTLTFTGASHTETVNCAAGATTYSKNLMPDTYVISSSTGTLSPLSVESFTVVKDAVTHNIYYPEAAVPAATQQNITVDNTLNVASANNYKTVTDALAAAKAGGISAPVITLTSGQTYREQVIVDIADVTFKTSGTEKATITFYYGIGYCYYSLNSKGVYDKDRAMTRNSIIKKDPERWGATVKVTRNGKNFKAENIIFENSFNQYYTQEEIIDGVQPNGVQSITYDRTLTANESGYKAADSKAVTERAAAIAFEGDPKGCQLYNCEFRGSQDTFYTGSSNTLYVKDCNIIGNTDYIFGGGYVVFDNCDLTIGGYSDQDVSAYITAYKDGDNLEAGKCYVFRDCTVKGSNRTHVKANLGRDWGGAAASVYYFNLKNEIGNKLSYAWSNMGGGVSAGTANLHIYDFDPTINANYSSTGASGANINGILSDDDALSLYANVVGTLGFTPERIYEDALELGEASYYNVCRIAAAANAGNNVTRTVQLTRAIGADKWNTIVLPFDMTADQVTSTFGEGTKLAQLTSGSTADNLKFTTATEITANQPYAIKVPTAITVAEPVNISGVTIKGDEPTQEAGGWNFVGTYTKGNIPQDSYFFSDNKLYQAADETNTIKAFRAWFTYNGANASRNLSFTIDDETTSISEEIRVKGEESDGVIYDLQGRRVRSAEANSSLFTIHSSLKPGVYIVNGKCVIIK